MYTDRIMVVYTPVMTSGVSGMRVKLAETCPVCRSGYWCEKPCARKPMVEVVEGEPAAPVVGRAVVMADGRADAAVTAGRNAASKQSRAAAAIGLPLVGRGSVQVNVRLSDEEAEHLDEIRGAFSRVDGMRIVLRAAKVLGL